jgi:hypothetical protein
MQKTPKLWRGLVARAAQHGLSLPLVCKSSQFLQAIGNSTSIVGLGLLNCLYCLMLHMGSICTRHSLWIFSKLFQILSAHIPIGMFLA